VERAQITKKLNNIAIHDFKSKQVMIQISPILFMYFNKEEGSPSVNRSYIISFYRIETKF
jgi:hypothetical protein